jgi:hypothetical protein
MQPYLGVLNFTGLGQLHIVDGKSGAEFSLKKGLNKHASYSAWGIRLLIA